MSVVSARNRSAKFRRDLLPISRFDTAMAAFAEKQNSSRPTHRPKRGPPLRPSTNCADVFSV